MENEQEEQVDIHTLKYALYVRKSTDDKERQQRSTDDQIAECEELAANLGIRLAKPYYEDHASAKIPENPKRDRFKDMLNDLQAGKVNGIIAWHPDRLARNMQDGGKMLLGISFTLSTYYSANLSQNVKRGHKRAFKEGNLTSKTKRNR
jgi:site-specific DNA recombinase